MTNHKFIKILALIAIVAFIVVYAMTHFRVDPQKNASKTYSDFETTWPDTFATVTSESTTEYYDDNGSVTGVMNTKIDFRSTIINDNHLRWYCKCTAEYNNQIVTQIFQNDITVSNLGLTQEFAIKTIDQPSKQCADECKKYGEAQFFGKE